MVKNRGNVQNQGITLPTQDKLIKIQKRGFALMIILSNATDIAAPLSLMNN